MHAVKEAAHTDAVPVQPEVLSKHKRPVIVWASIAFFCMCAMLLGMTIWIVWSSREVRLHEAQATTEHMARTLATQAYMELEVADVMLEDIVEHIRNEGNNDATGERLQSHLQQLSKNIVEIAGVFIFDSRGDWLASSSGAGQDGNNADRDYFTYHKTHAQLGSRISAPVRSKSSGQWVLPVSRRVELADGSFAGVVLVTLGLASFERIYDSLNLGNTGTAFFALDDGTLIYRRPFQSNVIGMDISSGAVLRAYREKGPVGTAMMTAKVDEIERLYSYRHLQRFPVIVAAGLSEEDIFAEWQRLSMQIVLASLAAGAALIYLFRKLMRQIA
ncbi:MAG: cache domain-containing protein, partial [Janthinobacterium sp.]